MEKIERILIVLVALSGIITFAGLAVTNLIHGDFDACAAYTLITGIILVITSAVKKEL